MKPLLQVFAKAPVPGGVKTRLEPALGARGAAELHCALVERTLGMATTMRDTHEIRPTVELWCAPDDSHPFFLHCAQRFSVGLRVQQGVDLGARMHDALADALAHGRLPVLIGTDCPPLTIERLAEAFAAIDVKPCPPVAPGNQARRPPSDVVLLPTEDGGYALIGAAQIDPGLFDQVTWSSPAVFEQTLARAARLGWRIHAMEKSWDVDRPEDLSRLRTLVPGMLEPSWPGPQREVTNLDIT